MLMVVHVIREPYLIRTLLMAAEKGFRAVKGYRLLRHVHAGDRFVDGKIMNGKQAAVRGWPSEKLLHTC
jgi:hypothetical protein